MAEELERAAINRKRREERTRKRAEKDREEAAIKLAQEQARLKAEAEMKERKRLEDNRRLQEQARAKLLEETRINLEAEQRAVASRTKVKREEKKRQDRSQKEEPVRTPEGPKHASEESHTCLSSLTVASLDPTVAIEKVVSSPNAVSADERKASRYLKMKEKRKEKLAKKRQQKEEQAEKLTTPLIGSSSAVSKADVKKAHPLVISTSFEKLYGLKNSHRRQLPKIRKMWKRLTGERYAAFSVNPVYKCNHMDRMKTSCVVEQSKVPETRSDTTDWSKNEPKLLRPIAMQSPPPTCVHP